MAASIIRLSTGGIARTADGKICKIDLSAAPTPLSVSFDWTCGHTGGSDLTPPAFNVVYTQSTITYSGTTRYPVSGFLDTDYYGTADFSVSLVIGSGFVRWIGHFDLFARHRGYIFKFACVDVNIHRDCPAGGVNPRGVYVVDSYIQNKPVGEVSNYVTEGTTITLS